MRPTSSTKSWSNLMIGTLIHQGPKESSMDLSDDKSSTELKIHILLYTFHLKKHDLKKHQISFCSISKKHGSKNIYKQKHDGISNFKKNTEGMSKSKRKKKVFWNAKLWIVVC